MVIVTATTGVTVVVTLIVMLFEVAVVGLAQGSFEVSTHDITSESTIVEFV